MRDATLDVDTISAFDSTPDHVTKADRLKGAAKAYSLTALLIVLSLGTWQLAASFSEPYILPAPTAIAKSMAATPSVFLTNAVPTAESAALGFFIGLALAIVTSTIFLYVPVVRRAAYPLVIAIESVPTVAIAPLLIIIFGNGLEGRVVITTIVGFFAPLIGLTKGLTDVDQDSLDYFDTLSAGRVQTFVWLRWPHALPELFTSLRLSASLVTFTAVIAEWVSADKGLGYLIIVASHNFQVLLMWSAVVASTTLALIAFGLVVLVEGLVLKRRRGPH